MQGTITLEWIRMQTFSKNKSAKLHFIALAMYNAVFITMIY